MVYGVPYELFWHLNPAKMQPFKEAYRKRQEMNNQFAWMQGLYIQNAVGSLFSNNSKYPDRPLDLFESNESALSPEEEFKVWIEVYNAKFGEKDTAQSLN